ncbi:hypothetical protein Bhyg_05438, partial [Pseudolycoriella hygida]
RDLLRLSTSSNLSRNALPIQYVEKRFEKPFDMVDNPIIVELEEATVEISPEAQEMEVSSWHIVRSCADIEEVNLNSNAVLDVTI